MFVEVFRPAVIPVIFSLSMSSPSRERLSYIKHSHPYSDLINVHFPALGMSDLP